MEQKKKTRLGEILIPRNYDLVMEVYKIYKKEGDLEKILFFKSFVSMCLKSRPITFNDYLSGRKDTKDLIKYVEGCYFDIYKKDHYIYLYETLMTHYELI